MNQPESPPSPGAQPLNSGLCTPPLKSRAAQQWCLSGRVHPDASVLEVQISSHSFSIGRRANNNLCLTDATVSGHHAELVRIDNRLFIKDLNSTNGTFVNGRRIEGLESLCDGDRLQFGAANFTVRHESEPAAGATVTADVACRALAYFQFDKLLGDPAVIPYFQPIVRIDGLQCLGYEMLARSQLIGLETPAKMFGIAGELSSNTELSCLLRREGLRQAEQFELKVPVYLNTHPSEVNDDHLLASLESLHHEFPDSLVVLEIHEAAVTSAAVLTKLRSELRRLGIGLAYDDFGAGQARLLELADAPPDVIKFDMSLIRGLDTAPRERTQMVATLVKMVCRLGAVPLAEGVETAGEAAVCQDLGFELGQGFFFGHPAPATAFTPANAAPNT